MCTHVHIIKFKFLNFETIENDRNFLTRYLFLYRFICLIVTSIRWVKLYMEKFWSIRDQYFMADVDHYSRFLWRNEKSANDIRSPDSVVEPHHSMHISRKGREKEREKVKSLETNELNLYANAFIFYLEYEQSMDACRDPVVVAVSTSMHNERATGYQDLSTTSGV